MENNKKKGKNGQDKRKNKRIQSRKRRDEVKTKQEEREEFIKSRLQYSVEEQRDIRLNREEKEQQKKEELWRNINISPKLEREEYTTSEYKGIRHKYDREI